MTNPHDHYPNPGDQDDEPTLFVDGIEVSVGDYVRDVDKEAEEESERTYTRALLNAISAKFMGLWKKDKKSDNKILLAHAGPEEGIANMGETGRPSLVATFIDETEYQNLTISGKLPKRITYIVYPVSPEWVKDMYNSPLPIADDVLVLEVDGDEVIFRSISNRGVFEYKPYNTDPQDLNILLSYEGLIEDIIKMPTQAGYSAGLLHRLAYFFVEVPHSELPINLRITHFTGNYYGAVKQDP